jgi:hypothetical protein
MNFVPNKKTGYAEEGQPFPLKFQWVRQERESLVGQHGWINCRDFLGDALWMKRNEDTKTKIYGFGIDNKFVEDNYMAITFEFLGGNKAKHKKALLSNLHWFEKWGSACPVVLEQGDVLVLRMDKFWRRNIWLVSLWSYMVKALAWAPKQTEETLLTKLGQKEEMYCLSVGRERLIKLLNNLGKFEIKTYNEYSSPHTVHNNEGFVSRFAAKAKANEYAKQLDSFA